MHFFLNKLFGQLLDISLQNFIFSKICISEFSYIEVFPFAHNMDKNIGKNISKHLSGKCS